MFLQRFLLVVQWLRFHVPNAGTQVQSLARELDPTCHIPNSNPMTQRSQMNALITFFKVNFFYCARQYSMGTEHRLSAFKSQLCHLLAV